MKLGHYIHRVKAQRNAYKSAFDRVALEMLRGGITAEIYAGIETELLAELEALNNTNHATTEEQ